MVLRNVFIGKTCETFGLSKPKTTQHLVGLLDRLCEHWVIDADRAARKDC